MMPSKPESLEELLAADLAQLTCVTGENGTHFETLGMTGERNTGLTLLERRAVIGEVALARTESLAILARATAALSFRAARDLEQLEIPDEVEVARPTASSKDHAATRDALAGMIELIDEVLSIKRNRGEMRSAGTLLGIRQRLKLLETSERAWLERAGARIRERCFYLPVDLRALRKVHTDPELSKPPSADDDVAASQRHSLRLNLQPRDRLRLAVLALCMAALLHTVIDTTTELRKLPGRLAVRPVAAAELEVLLPQAVVGEEIGSAERPGLHVRTGPEFDVLGPEERTRKLIGATTLIAAHAYEQARFTDASGRPVAQWLDGRLWIIESTPLEGVLP